MPVQSKAKPPLSTVEVEALFRAHSGRLFNYACQLTRGHIQNAEDLVIETFVCLAQHANAPMEHIQKNPYAYLRKILTNVFLADRRRQQAQRRRAELPAGTVDLDALSLADNTDPGKQYEQQELILQACRYALTRMKTSNRGQVLLLRYFLGYTSREIAQILGMTVNAVDKALSQARTEVRNCLEMPGECM